MADTDKLVFMVLHGPDHPEHATIPFVMAGAALASDVAVVMGFQADGVELVKRGVADGVAAEDLVEGAEIVAAGRSIAEITSATNALTY
jgi:predicted peroxiredoxin